MNVSTNVFTLRAITDELLQSSVRIVEINWMDCRFGPQVHILNPNTSQHRLDHLLH